MELSESFYIFLVTTSAGLILACLKIAYESKCKNLDLCCIKIVRDTGAELAAEHDRLEHGISNPLPQELPKPQERQSRLSIDRD
jgi:hypothetical protein